MNYTHAKRNKQAPPAVQTPEQLPAQGPNLDALRTGLAQPTAAQKGRRADLPDAMRAKMEASFGADLSAVKLYESEAVADAGAEAVTRGNEIAFAPGMLDFSSFGGQVLLGHELSHVVSQRSGEVTGGGFLHDSALEARADREGAMAAAGQQVAMPAAAMSAVTAAPAAGPMQAKKLSKEEKEQKRRQKQANKTVDRMYRIQAAKMWGGDQKQISEEDENYYNYMLDNLDYDSYKELRDRGNKAAWDLVALRENMQGDDADALNYEAAWSDPALDMDIFSQLSAESSYSPGGNQYNEEQHLKILNAKEQSDWFTEDSKKQKQAAKILDANYLEEDTKGNRHLQKLRQTEEGKQEIEDRKADRTKRAMDIYRGKKKKKKKGWFSWGG